MTDWSPYVGLPFGEGPGEVTCWSLVRRIYVDFLRVDLPAYGEVSAHDLLRVAREMTVGAGALCWAEPETTELFDVVLMRSARGGRAVCHVGLVCSTGMVLHAEETTGSVIVPAAHFTIRHRISGYRRYVQ